MPKKTVGDLTYIWTDVRASLDLNETYDYQIHPAKQLQPLNVPTSEIAQQLVLEPDFHQYSLGSNLHH